MDPKVREHQYEQLAGDKRATQDAASTGKLSGRKTFNDGLCLGIGLSLGLGEQCFGEGG